MILTKILFNIVMYPVRLIMNQTVARLLNWAFFCYGERRDRDNFIDLSNGSHIKAEEFIRECDNEQDVENVVIHFQQHSKNINSDKQVFGVMSQVIPQKHNTEEDSNGKIKSESYESDYIKGIETRINDQKQNIGQEKIILPNAVEFLVDYRFVHGCSYKYPFLNWNAQDLVEDAVCMAEHMRSKYPNANIILH